MIFQLFKMKDPAFLFYPKDFQSGTQDMSCDEVGAYLRLLMYQHQHGSIPNDTERMMRITGIFSVEKWEMVWQMVKPKFNQNGNHLVNERLAKELSTRATAKPKKTASATLAGLISSNKQLSDQEKNFIKKSFKILDFIDFNEDEIKIKVREWFYDLVNQMVNNFAIANAIANVDINKDKGKEGTGEKPLRKPKPKLEVEPEVKFPFESEIFKSQWQLWKVYKQKEFKFSFKTVISEQSQLTELRNLSENNEKTAIAIINQSMAHGWKGFFELKNNQHGKPKQENTDNGPGFDRNR